MRRLGHGDVQPWEGSRRGRNGRSGGRPMAGFGDWRPVRPVARRARGLEARRRHADAASRPRWDERAKWLAETGGELTVSRKSWPEMARDGRRTTKTERAERTGCRPRG